MKKGSRKAHLAGVKAAQTRARNKRQGKTSRKPARGKAKTRRKGHIPIGFQKYRVNKAALIKKLNSQKATSFKPTEVVSLTWKVIKGQK